MCWVLQFYTLMINSKVTRIHTYTFPTYQKSIWNMVKFTAKHISSFGGFFVRCRAPISRYEPRRIDCVGTHAHVSFCKCFSSLQFPVENICVCYCGWWREKGNGYGQLQNKIKSINKAGIFRLPPPINSTKIFRNSMSYPHSRQMVWYAFQAHIYQ